MPLRDPSARAIPARPVRPSAAPVCVAVALLIGSTSAAAQQRSLSVTPTFTASQEFTDNRSLSSSDRQVESITTFSPGIRVSSRSGRVQGSLDYSLSAVLYARDSSASSLQNALSANMAAEVIEQHAFFDALASISRQYVSAFGSQADRPNDINPNSTEVRSLSLSPSLRGRLFGEVDVEARLTSSFSSSADNRASDSSSHDASLSLGSNAGRLGWTVVGSRSISDYDAGRRTTQDRVNAQISYAFDPTLRAFVSFGRESNDVLSVDQRNYNTWGGGITWLPTSRTQLSVQAERRYFGNSHSLSFSHRMRRAVVSYTDSRSENRATAGVGFTLTVYELYFSLFASLEPDPSLRDLLVRNYLRAAGLDPDQRVTGGFLNTALTIQDSRTLSLALQGRRNNLVISAFTTSTRRADSLSQAQDDLSQVERVRQYGLTTSLSHRLTATSSAVVSVSHQRTPDSGTVEGSGVTSVSASWSDRISERASVALTARHSRSSGANDYQESSVLATYSQTF